MPITRDQAKAKLIVALDVPSEREALALVRRLDDHVGLFKVGLELFVSAGPSILSTITDATDAGIFLDLKFHDIPETVKGASRAASRPRIRFLTVHCEQAARLTDHPQRSPSGPDLLGVTVLTSVGAEDLSAAKWYAPDLTVERLVLLRARLALDAGCVGVVCSGHEARAVKARFGSDTVVVVPGVRPSWAEVTGDDQRRSITPAEAVAAGADYVVVGRPIRTAPDPSAAADRILDEIAAV